MEKTRIQPSTPHETPSVQSNSDLTTAVVIPAYQPGPILLDLFNELQQKEIENIIVVNDGSNPNSKPIFDRIEKLGGTVLNHGQNLGKGQALKTAFNFILSRLPQVKSVLTCDADGQHHADDVLNLFKVAAEKRNELLLGSREFDDQVIPWRSRFGNKVTKQVFRFLVGQALTDTQTGLRVIPRSFLPALIQIKTGRYEFEMEMLVLAGKKNIPLREVSIQTIYEENNPTSHFNPLLDSLRIYFVFIRFSIASIASAITDIVSFTLFYYLTSELFLSLLSARVISATLNFWLGRRFTFQSKLPILPQAGKYLVVASLHLFATYTIIYSEIQVLALSVYSAKLFTECTIFLINFLVQLNWVYAEPNKHAVKSTDSLGSAYRFYPCW